MYSSYTSLWSVLHGFLEFDIPILYMDVRKIKFGDVELSFTAGHCPSKKSFVFIVCIVDVVLSVCSFLCKTNLKKAVALKKAG